MRFVFTGSISAPKDAKLIELQKAKSGAPYYRMSGSVVADQNNRAFIEMPYAGKQDNVYISGENRGDKAVRIPWDERNNEEYLNRRMNSFRYVDAETTHDFATAYDMASYLKDVDLGDKTYRVNGNLVKNVYNGKISDRFQVIGIREVNDDRTKGFSVTGEFFFSKESIDTADYKNEGRIYINGWTLEYNADIKDKQYMPLTIVFDCNKLGESMSRWHGDSFGIEFEGDTAKVTLKKDKYYSLNVVLDYHNGAREVEFSEDELTPFQKKMVKQGLKTLDDFRPAASTYGERVSEFVLADVDYRGKWADGRVECGDLEELESKEYRIYTAADADGFMNLPADSDLDDLFG